jgi:protein-L-isoaspartate(D-aspartate) O-methyltransferase
MTNISENPARDNMLKSQILTGHVLNPMVLAALESVSRESFVPDSFKGVAYVDEEIPLSANRSLMEPLVFARLLSYADIKWFENVLDIGVATGYSAAIISTLAQNVVAIEEDEALAAKAQQMLSVFPNVEFKKASLAQGQSKSAPYDVILIQGAIEVIPPAIADQLAEGGRLLAIEHAAQANIAAVGLGKIVEYRKLRCTLYKTTLRDANVALLPAFAKASTFAL